MAGRDDTDPTDDMRPIPRAVAIPFVLAFLLLIAAGPLLLVFGPRVKSRAARPFPEWSFAAFREGRFAEDLRLHLRETSAVTVTLRGIASEGQFLLGIHEADVMVGTGGAMFAPFAVRPDFRRVRAQRGERQAFYRELAQWTAARDVHLLCVVVPDKIRVIPERLYEGGRLPEPKASAYAEFLAELREAGLETVDVAAEMARARAERPDVPLYRERDTHWTAAGAWRTTRLVADRLRATGWLDGVPPAPVVAMPALTFRSPEDLAALCGFLADGLFAARVADVWDSGGVRLAAPAGPSRPMSPAQPDAGIALCGDSFAAGMLTWTLPAATGRLVDTVGAVAGKGPLAGLIDTLERIERGELRPRVIVWEVIERSQAEGFWVPRPKLP